MNNELTEIAFILDCSGSMETLAAAAIQGFNEFLHEQQIAPGRARLTVALFDDEYLLHADAVPVEEVVPLNAETYVPRGSTALIDAIGRTIDTLGARLGKTPEHERPGKVVVAILTDGLENASTVFNPRQISQRIRHQREKYAWEFLFLGANQDAIVTAARMNIAAADSASLSDDAHGYRSGTAALSRKTVAYRSAMIGAANPVDFAAPMSELVQQEEAKRREE